MSQGGHFEMQVVPARPECGNIKPGSNCSHSQLELLGKEAAFHII